MIKLLLTILCLILSGFEVGQITAHLGHNSQPAVHQQPPQIQPSLCPEALIASKSAACSSVHQAADWSGVDGHLYHCMLRRNGIEIWQARQLRPFPSISRHSTNHEKS
uniref:Uncharacterized protein n=1 Tax=Globodera rostochiensis TaxID=31243 RepID=A0A914I189_GLORO